MEYIYHENEYESLHLRKVIDEIVAELNKKLKFKKSSIGVEDILSI